MIIKTHLTGHTLQCQIRTAKIYIFLIITCLNNFFQKKRVTKLYFHTYKYIKRKKYYLC